VKRIIGIMKESFTPAVLILFAMVIVLLMISGRSKGARMTQFETRISETLSQMEGVGTVSVVVRTTNKAQQSKALSAYSGMEEIPCGAVAVAEGGEDPLIRMKLTNALCALLGLHASQVEVIGMGEGG